MKQIPILLAGALLVVATITLLSAPGPIVEAAGNGDGPFVMSFRPTEKGETLVMRMDTRTGQTEVALVPVVLHRSTSPKSQEARIHWNKITNYVYSSTNR